MLRTALFLALALVGCATDTRFGRHGDCGIWGDAMAEQWQNPWRAVPEASLLVATGALIPLDDEIQEDFSRPEQGDDALPGDLLMGCALGLPLIYGGVAWAGGDSGGKLETAAEAIAATWLTVYVLKETTNRERPDGSADNSFPSGHTAAAFCGATLLANFIEQDTASRSKLGYLLYIPATYVAVNRVQVDKHWATDVAAGAFFGTFFANLIFDAHYGDEERGHEGILRPERDARWAIVPDVSERRTGVLFQLDF